MKRLSALSTLVLVSVILMTSCDAGKDARGWNSLPVAADDSYTTNESIPLSIEAPGILGNDTDSDSDDLDAIFSTDPPHGTLELDRETGSFVYSPNANFTGNDSFTYRANDGTGNSNLATVTIIVNVHGQPIALDDSYTTNKNIPLTSGTPGILGNDTNNDSDDLDAIFSTDPPHGTLELDGETDSFVSSPNANFTGNCNLWQIDRNHYQSFDGFCCE